jgi:hypothetical protein
MRDQLDITKDKRHIQIVMAVRLMLEELLRQGYIKRV